MRRFAFLLKPQWLALYVVAIAFAYLCFTVLAPWQLGKNTTTSRENAQISNSVSQPPVPVTTLLPQQDSSAPGDQWRQVTATGRYQPEAQVLVRLRVVDGNPAYEVLLPFHVDGGPTVLVDRGYVKPDRGTEVPEFAAPPTGTVTITARLRDPESVVVGKEPFRENGIQQVYSINPDQVAKVTGVPVAGSYLQLVDGQPGGLGVIGLPTSTRGRSCPTASSGSRSGSSRRSALGTSCWPRSNSAAGRRPRAIRGPPPRRRSPRSRSSPTGTADGSDHDCRHRSGELNGARQPHRSGDVGDLRRPALPQRRPNLQAVGVLRWSAQPHTEGAGERRFDHPRVGARVARGVPAPGRHRCQRGARDDGCTHHRQQPRDAGGQIVGDVVESGCRPTEL